MELEKEDIILKNKRDNNLKRQIEYQKKYLKDPKNKLNYKNIKLLYKKINIYESYKGNPKPKYMNYQKEWYEKQRESRKNPFLRSNDGEFILTFN